jgi:methyl-accepting chemotaxis protein
MSKIAGRKSSETVLVQSRLASRGGLTFTAWSALMLRLSNIRTGTKLAVMSAISILLVIGMITAQLLGNSTSTDAQAAAARRSLIMSDSIDAKASVRGMQVGVRDLQLAATKEQLEKASKYIAARHESAVKYLTQSI